MNKSIIEVMGFVLLLAVQTSCRENKFGTVDLTLPEEGYEPVETEYTYNHPCAMFSQADFDRVKNMLNDGTAPQKVKDEFENLKNSSYVSSSYTPQPTSKIVRGDATGTGFDNENYSFAMKDAAAAYQMALLWKLTGTEQYAENVINILNQWAAICTEVTSNDANHKLAAGVQGYTFANAAEIMQAYDGWTEADKSTFKTWIVDVFASKNKDFLDNHQGSNNCALHYWSNWDLVNMCSYLSIGILTESDDMVNYVINYFYNGVGNGALSNLIQGTHIDPLSGEEICQNQESGRDQGHAQMSAAVTANLCQIAYTFYQDNKRVPQLDFFTADNNAVMKMGEYVALSNATDGIKNDNSDGAWLIDITKIPFYEYKYCMDCVCKDKNHGQDHTQVSADGRGEVRPGWEIYYIHYAKIKGLSSGYKYAQMLADKMRPEGGPGEQVNRYGSNSGAFDQLGWATLMLYRE